MSWFIIELMFYLLVMGRRKQKINLISRSNEGGTYTTVHRSEHLSNNTNPVWKKFTVPVAKLCNGDVDRNIRVECYDHNRSGSHSLIGEFYTTVRKMQAGPGDANVYELINPKKRVRKAKMISRCSSCFSFFFSLHSLLFCSWFLSSL